MTLINRNHSKAVEQQYDLIIIGGGIYGITLSLVASQLGLRNLVLERDDFGGATTYNSLRTIHGGLRYLQKMDLSRFMESVGERQWFMREFPGLVTPLPCLMPLYGNGAFRPPVFRVALAFNDFLCLGRNQGIRLEQQLPHGSVIDPQEVVRLFPQVDKNGLKGGAIWYDGGMLASQLLVMEILKQSCRAGSMALNYTEVDRLLKDGQKVQGVHCVDRETGREYRFRAEKVVNAAGPWCRCLAASFHRDDPELFKYSIAWNTLLNRPALSSHSLAVKPKKPGARMYFIHAWNGLILGGTVHSAWHGLCDNPQPDRAEIGAYLDNLNLAIPGLNLLPGDVLQIYSGLLPVKEQGTGLITDRAVVRDHGNLGGPEGLFTVSGVKFTTARKEAEKLIRSIFPGTIPLAATCLRRQPAPSLEELDSRFSWDWLPQPGSQGWQQRLSGIIREQSVLHLDDLVIRRTTIGDNPARAMKAAPLLCTLFPWEASRCNEEIKRLRGWFVARAPTENGFNRPAVS